METKKKPDHYFRHTIQLVCLSGDSGKNALSIINSKAHENSIAVKLVKKNRPSQALNPIF